MTSTYVDSPSDALAILAATGVQLPEKKAGICFIPLYGRGGVRSAFAVVDEEDAEWLRLIRWRVKDAGFTKYAVASAPAKLGDFNIYLHRMVLAKHGCELANKHVDHINHDGLDNRKVNLRAVSHSENASNQSEVTRQRKRKYGTLKGAHYDKAHRRWIAHGQKDGKAHHLGSFDTEEQAHAFYNSWEKENLQPLPDAFA